MPNVIPHLLLHYTIETNNLLTISLYPTVKKINIVRKFKSSLH